MNQTTGPHDPCQPTNNQPQKQTQDSILLYVHPPIPSFIQGRDQIDRRTAPAHQTPNKPNLSSPGSRISNSHPLAKERRLQPHKQPTKHTPHKPPNRAHQKPQLPLLLPSPLPILFHLFSPSTTLELALALVLFHFHPPPAAASPSLAAPDSPSPSPSPSPSSLELPPSVRLPPPDVSCNVVSDDTTDSAEDTAAVEDTDVDTAETGETGVDFADAGADVTTVVVVTDTAQVGLLEAGKKACSSCPSSSSSGMGVSGVGMSGAGEVRWRSGVEGWED